MSGSSPTPPITYEQFIGMFPVFKNELVFLQSDAELYLGLTAFFDPRRYGQYLNLASALFAAHFLTIDAQDMLSISRGGLPGQTTGPAVSKSVGGASISYAEYATIEGGTTGNSGHWNLTVYGKRYLRIAKMAGAGPVQITSARGGPPLGNTGFWYEQTNPNGFPIGS
jgi:hypothetical protein